MPPENFNTRPKESNVPPLNNDFESNVPQLFILDSRTFVAKSGLSRLRAFWGALLAKIWWEGAQKHFKGPGDKVSWGLGDNGYDDEIKMTIMIIRIGMRISIFKIPFPWFFKGSFT